MSEGAEPVGIAWVGDGRAKLHVLPEVLLCMSHLSWEGFARIMLSWKESPLGKCGADKRGT